MKNLLEKAKKIQAAISSAALKAPKLNFPILIAIVFSKVRGKSRKFSKSFFRAKKKKAENPQNTMENSTKKVDNPAKHNRIVAEICMKALWKLINLENLIVEKNTVKAMAYSYIELINAGMSNLM